MKKYIISIIAISCFVVNIEAQDTKTGNEESSVIFNNSNLGFDFAEAALSFKYNNLNLNKDNKLLWGVAAEGKNSEGLASIFSSSEIVPASKISLLLGYSWSNSNIISETYNNAAKKAKDRRDNLGKKFETSIKKTIKYYIDSFEKSKPLVHSVLKAQYDKTIKQIGYSPLEKFLEELSTDTKQTLEDRLVAARLLKKLFTKNPDWKEYKKLNKIILKKTDYAAGEVDKEYLEELSRGFRRTSVYLHYGNASTKFNTFIGWDSLNLTNSFMKNTFKGSNGGFGINRNFRNKWIFGFRYTYEETNNLSGLTTTEYKVTTTNTATNTTGTTELKKTAYPNTFQNAYVNNYDFDVIRFVPLGSEDILLLDAYLRINESLNQERLVSQTNLGISASFFNGTKGNFIGGLYLELPDINQNVEREKLKEEQELNPFYKRLTFGIFTKFSFTKLRKAVD